MAADIVSIGIKVDASSVNSASNSLDKFQRSAGAADTAVSSLKNVLAGLAASFGIREIARASDTFATLNAQLKISTGSAAGAARAYGEVFRIAKASGQSIDEIANVYRRLSDVSGDIGINQEQVARTTEAVANAIALSGGSAAGAQAALTQFGQGLASGTLRGEELNSVLEQAPRLARALADGLGVPIGQLRELAQTGAITSQAIVAALARQRQVLEQEFSQLPLTLGRAFTNLNNSFIDTVGRFESGAGVFGGVASAIDKLAKNLDSAAVIVSGFASIYAGRFIAGLVAATSAKIIATNETRKLAAAEVLAAQSALSNARAMGAATLSATGLAAASSRLAAAQSAVAASGRAASFLSFLGGPIGAITTALSLGAAAWTLWGSRSEESSEKASMAAETSTKSIVSTLDVQIAKLKERNRLASSGFGAIAQGGGESQERVSALQARMDAIRNRQGQFSGINEVARSELLKQTGLELASILSRLKSVDEEQAKLESFGKTSKASEWLVKYATDAERLQIELKKARDELGSAFTPEIEQRIRQRFSVKGAKDNKSDSARIEREAQEMVDNWSPLTLRWELDPKVDVNADLAEWQADSAMRVIDLANAYRDLGDPVATYIRQIQEVTALEAIAELSAEEAFNARLKLYESADKASEGLKDKVKEQKTLAEELGLTFQSAAEDAIVSFKSLGDVIEGVLKDILRIVVRQNITKPIGESLATVFGSIFGGTKKAAGGYISGPGTSTSDSIPARLSNGEYVVRASAVKKIGVGALDAINSGMTPRRFNQGGFVGSAPAGSMRVQIINNTPAQVTTRQTGDGGLQVLIENLEAELGSRLSNGVGAVNSAMQGRFGLRPSMGY